MHIKNLSVIITCAAIKLISPPAYAMDFYVSGNEIYAVGEIEDGDTNAFFSAAGYNIKSDVDNQIIMNLSSPGGSLMEGIRLGRELKRRGISANILSGQSCLSACAFAFLGGTLQYATGIGPGRQLEWGANLGFHGYSYSEKNINVANETLSESRVINAIVLEYIQYLGSVDYDWISKALTVDPEEMYFANTPRAMDALSIIVTGGPNNIPADWDLNLCSKIIDPNLLFNYQTLNSISQIRTNIANPILNNYGIIESIPSDELAINLAFGRGFNLNLYRPIQEARFREVERGAGTYFDACLTLRSSTQFVVAIVDYITGYIKWEHFGPKSFVEQENTSLPLMHSVSPLW